MKNSSFLQSFKDNSSNSRQKSGVLYEVTVRKMQSCMGNQKG